MLGASQAVRLGLRAASRNPELAFGKALLDLAGTLVALLPVLAASVLLLRAFGDERPLQALAGVALALRALRWPLAGALLAGAALSWALAAGFWAGALPVLAADAEMQARPPPGTFLTLAFRGFPRVLGASAVAGGLSLLVGLGFGAGIAFVPVALAARPSPGVAAAGAALIAAALVLDLLVDLLARLVLVRSAAFGDAATVAVGRAAGLLGERLGACLAIAIAFLVMELVVASAGGALAGWISAAAGLDAGAQLVSIGPRAALAAATGAIFAWLETGRQGALAALAADAEGLIELAPEPVPAQPFRVPAAWELRPQRPPPPPAGSRPWISPGDLAPPREPIVEALPAPEEPVVEALPAPEEPVVEALPVPEEPVAEALPAAGARPAPGPAEGRAPEAHDPGEGTGTA